MPALITAGAELQTVEQINELVKRGLEVSLVILSTTIEEPLIETLSLAPDRILRLENRHHTLIAAALPSLRGFGRVAKFLNDQQVDMCIAMLPFSHFFMRLTMLRCLSVKVKLIVYHHSLQYFASPLDTVAKKIFNSFNSALARLTDNQHWFISEASRDDLQQNFFSTNVQVIPNAKSFDGIADREAAADLLVQYEVSDEDFCILFPGRLHPTKGHVACLASFKKFLTSPTYQLAKQRIKMLVVGYGTTEMDVRELIKQQGLEQCVKMVGKIDNRTLMALYEKCPITLVPSISEGFGLVAIEAMANRSVVIASDAGGLRDVVQHGKNGYQFPVGDYDRMNDLLNSVMTNYPGIDLDQVASDTRSKYSIRSQIDSMLKLL